MVITVLTTLDVTASEFTVDVEASDSDQATFVEICATVGVARLGELQVSN